MEEQETGTTFLNTHLLDGFCTVFSILPDWISGRVLQKKGGAKTPMPTSRNILKIPDLELDSNSRKHNINSYHLLNV